MRHRVTLIPGEGIGPEVAQAAQQIIEAAGVAIEWEEVSPRARSEAGSDELAYAGVVESVRRNRVGLKGPLATEIGIGAPSINVGLRKALELYANLRPVKNLEGVKARVDGVDLVIIRENTEDLYAGLEHTVVPGVVESLKIITEKASTRKVAADYPEIEYKEMIVDNTCMQLVLDPHQFDVLLLPNLYGDVVSDL